MFQRWETPHYRNDLYLLPAAARPGGEPPALCLETLGRFTSFGRFRYEQVSPTFSLHVIHCGRGIMHTAGRDYHVGPGDLFCFFPGEHYRYEDAPGHPWHYTWLILSGPQTPHVLALAGLTPDRPHQTGHFFAQLDPLFLPIERACREESGSGLLPISAAWQLADALASEHAPAQPTSAGHEATVALAARRLLEREYMTPIGVEQIAGRLGVTRVTLFRHFKAAYGLSPKQYLHQLRLSQASQLLRRTTTPVQLVAEQCGFPSAHYFTRAFQAHFGQPPTLWRRGKE